MKHSQAPHCTLRVQTALVQSRQEKYDVCRRFAFTILGGGGGHIICHIIKASSYKDECLLFLTVDKASNQLTEERIKFCQIWPVVINDHNSIVNNLRVFGFMFWRKARLPRPMQTITTFTSRLTSSLCLASKLE